MFFFKFSIDRSLFLRISTIYIILLSLLYPSTYYSSRVSSSCGWQLILTDIAVSTSRSIRATDLSSRAPLVSYSISTPSSWSILTLSRKYRESNNSRTISTSIYNKSTISNRAYISSLPLTIRGTTSTHQTYIPLPSTTRGIILTRSTTIVSTSTITSSTNILPPPPPPLPLPPASPPPASPPPATHPTTPPHSTTSTLISITTTSSTASTLTPIPIILSTEICSYSSDCEGSLYSLEEARSL
jgi:hypothetical protein